MIYKQQEIQTWAGAKGIYDGGGDFIAQVKGMAEEVVEATEAFGRLTYLDHSYVTELEKELGDIYVFWINACWTAGVHPMDCIDAAYNKILKRDGKMVNGRFVKT